MAVFQAAELLIPHRELLENSEDYRKLWAASEESRGWLLKGGESA